jgi:phosphoribosylformylglycinamidine (FGAM) synthase PurS component
LGARVRIFAAMLFKIRLVPKLGPDSPESLRVARTLADAGVNAKGVTHIRLFLIEGEISRADAERAALQLLADPVLETAEVYEGTKAEPESELLFHVMRRTGVMDPVEQSLTRALRDFGVRPSAVKTADQYKSCSPSANTIPTVTITIPASWSVVGVSCSNGIATSSENAGTRAANTAPRAAPRIATARV